MLVPFLKIDKNISEVNQTQKIDDLSKDIKTLLKKVSDLDKSLEVFKVRSEKLPNEACKS